jgi:hypothetical protein
VRLEWYEKHNVLDRHETIARWVRVVGDLGALADDGMKRIMTR